MLIIRAEAGKKLVHALKIIGIFLLVTAYIVIVNLEVDYVQMKLAERAQAAEQSRLAAQRKIDDAEFRRLYSQVVLGPNSHINQAIVIALSADQGTYDEPMTMLDEVRSYALAGRDDWARIKADELDDYIAYQLAIKKHTSSEVAIVAREVTPELANCANKLSGDAKHKLGKALSDASTSRIRDAMALVSSEQAELTTIRHMNKLYVQYARGIVTASVFDTFMDLYTRNLNGELSRQTTLRQRLLEDGDDPRWAELERLLEDRHS